MSDGNWVMKKSDPNSRTMMSRGREIVQYILYSEKERENKLFYGLHHREGQAWVENHASPNR